MARATRVDFPGAWYHVLNRGIERRTIFPTRRGNERFIELLSSLPERFGVQLHAYALMGNHYHLQLESREANLSQAMHWLNVSYSVWFNRKYNRVGPLFQGRFKAILHETTEALMINRYIHLNPVRIAALGGTRESRHCFSGHLRGLSTPAGRRLGTILLELVRVLCGKETSTRMVMHRNDLGVFGQLFATGATRSVSATVAGSGSCRILGNRLEGES